jgi:hypothetical protein
MRATPQVGNFAPVAVQNTPVWAPYFPGEAFNEKSELRSDNFKISLRFSQLHCCHNGPIPYKILISQEKI